MTDPSIGWVAAAGTEEPRAVYDPRVTFAADDLQLLLRHAVVIKAGSEQASDPR